MNEQLILLTLNYPILRHLIIAILYITIPNHINSWQSYLHRRARQCTVIDLPSFICANLPNLKDPTFNYFTPSDFSLPYYIYHDALNIKQSSNQTCYQEILK